MLSRSFYVAGSLFGLLCTQACGSTTPADSGDLGATTGGTQGSGGSPATGGQPAANTGGVPQADGGAPASGGTTGGADPGVGGAPNGSGGNESGSGGGPPSDPTAAQLAAAAMGRGVNLGQMFESTQHPRTLAAASA